jgi:hypothetical protein
MPRVQGTTSSNQNAKEENEINLASPTALILRATMTAGYGVSLPINQEGTAGYCVCGEHLPYNTVMQSHANISKVICAPHTRYITQDPPELRCPVHGL